MKDDGTMTKGEQKRVNVCHNIVKETPNLRNILATTLMLDMVTGGPKSDTNKDK